MLVCNRKCTARDRILAGRMQEVEHAWPLQDNAHLYRQRKPNDASQSSGKGLPTNLTLQWQLLLSATASSGAQQLRSQSPDTLKPNTIHTNI